MTPAVPCTKRTNCHICVTGPAVALINLTHGLQVPIMLRSNYCSLAERSDKELADLGECPYDQVQW